MEDKKEITKEGIDKLLELPVLEKGEQLYEMSEIGGEFPDRTLIMNVEPYNYSEDVLGFINAFYNEDFILSGYY